MQICNIKVPMEFGSTLCSNEHHLSSSENEARKKIQACTRFGPMTSIKLVQCSTNCATYKTLIMHTEKLALLG